MASLKKALLVCSDPCTDIKQRLISLGYHPLVAIDGESAVERARRETFDAAILVSTGKDMDPLETVFNLWDIARSMPIFVLRGSGERELEDVTRFPWIRCCSLAELESILKSNLLNVNSD
jgi:DNA-binding response OmpR family regulator